MRLDPCAKEIIDRYGFDRVNFVLANTVRQSMEDGRYSEDNKKWARRFSVMDKENTWQYCVRSHRGSSTCLFADARRLWDKLGLYDRSHCDSERSGQIDYTGRILVLNPSVLKDECKTPQDQLFYATHGNGCHPDSLGTKVFGFHVADGEEGYYRRTEFVGALKRNSSPNGQRKTRRNILKPTTLPTNPMRTAA